MNKQEIAQGLSPFVMMAFVDAQNLETGFLTRHRINKLTKEQIMGFSMETEKNHKPTFLSIGTGRRRKYTH